MTTSPKSSTTVTDNTARDVIDALVGSPPAAAGTVLRAQRPDAARYAQASYQTLLAPADPAGISHIERAMIALRVAALTPYAPAVAWYGQRLRQLEASEAVIAAAEQGSDNAALSPRQRALLRHADRLTLAPHAATDAHIADLKAAGLSAAEIVTVAQLIAFVTFQVRVAAGISALAEEA